MVYLYFFKKVFFSIDFHGVDSCFYRIYMNTLNVKESEIKF